MAVNYSTSLKNTRMTDIVTAIGTGGRIEICTAGGVSVLIAFTLEDVAGTVSAGTLIFSGMPKNTAAVLAGTADTARIVTSTGTAVVTGLTVGTIGTDVIIDSIDVYESQDVTLSAAAITHS